MRPLIIATLFTFVATASFAQDFKAEDYKEQSDKMSVALSKAKKKAAKNGEYAYLISSLEKIKKNLAEKNVVVKDIYCGDYTTDRVELKTQAFNGKIAKVNFLSSPAFFYQYNDTFDNVEVTLSAEKKDLYARDPHHSVPVYANITVFKGDKVLEKGKVVLFTVERHQIDELSRAKEEPRYELNNVNGDPHANESYEPVVRQLPPTKTVNTKKRNTTDPHAENYEPVVIQLPPTKTVNTVGDPHANEKF